MVQFAVSNVGRYSTIFNPEVTLSAIQVAGDFVTFALKSKSLIKTSRGIIDDITDFAKTFCPSFVN